MQEASPSLIVRGHWRSSAAYRARIALAIALFTAAANSVTAQVTENV
jgi:hypothetical protein